MLKVSLIKVFNVTRKGVMCHVKSFQRRDIKTSSLTFFSDFHFVKGNLTVFLLSKKERVMMICTHVCLHTCVNLSVTNINHNDSLYMLGIYGHKYGACMIVIMLHRIFKII